MGCVSFMPGGGVGRGLALTVTIGATLLMCFFATHSCYVSSLAYSSPSIVIEAGRTHSGARVLYDDYREAYYWLRHNTDPDAKIMSWWDYGYQVCVGVYGGEGLFFFKGVRGLVCERFMLMIFRGCGF